MTVKVNGPDGLVVNFPDGTDRETINRVMSEASVSYTHLTLPTIYSV